jgi:murein DD-endopeptidase MepM/ murein hydrolase activator NlpD
MPPGFDPRQDEGFEVVVSPPGQRAPEGVSYTPATDEVHGLGESPPIQRTNYTIVPAGKQKSEVPPGTPSAFPMPNLSLPPGGPGSPPGAGGPGLPPGPGGPGPLGRTPPPTPPLNLGGASPPPPGLGGPPTGWSPTPTDASAADGDGSTRGGRTGLRSIRRPWADGPFALAALVPPNPVGAGQDVGVGAALPTGGAPARQGDFFPVQGYTGQVDPHGAYTGGSDIFADEGTPVVAMRGGTVVSVTRDAGRGEASPGGNSVLIRGDDGNQYYYAHLRNAPLVSQGARIPAGTQLGEVGTSGNAASRGTRPHLHSGPGDEPPTVPYAIPSPWAPGCHAPRPVRAHRW